MSEGRGQEMGGGAGGRRGREDTRGSGVGWDFGAKGKNMSGANSVGGDGWLNQEVGRYWRRGPGDSHGAGGNPAAKYSCAALRCLGF